MFGESNIHIYMKRMGGMGKFKFLKKWKHKEVICQHLMRQIESEMQAVSSPNVIGISAHIHRLASYF